MLLVRRRFVSFYRGGGTNERRAFVTPEDLTRKEPQRLL
jgi:hypothetical protein